MPRVLLFGSTGQLGQELRAALDQAGEVVVASRAEYDFTRPSSVAGIVRGIHPDVVVNAAAYTQVDRAESDRETARLVNTESVAALAGAAADVGALLVQYSTDYVYDGSGTRPWAEDDPTEPVNIYGVTKLAGERAIAESGCARIILRVSWLFGRHGQNFLKTMLSLASQRPSLRVVSDQVGAPTGAEMVAAKTAAIIPQVLADRSREGTYNLAAAGETNWHDYAAYVVETAREAGWPVVTQTIAAITTSEYPTPARRPLNSRLDTTRIRSVFDLSLPDWRADVRRVVGQLVSV